MEPLESLTWPEIREDQIKEKYPLHWYVWYDNTEKLDEALQSKLYDQEAKDPHGRTPLILAICLGFNETVKTLLEHGCDATASDKQGWNATQEAVGTGDPELLSLIIQYREYQHFTQKSGGMQEILESLEETDDFYVEMKWEFSSWIPLVSRVCPSDSYKIYKSVRNRSFRSRKKWWTMGCQIVQKAMVEFYKSDAFCTRSYVRVDTTLKGFEQMNWQRGNQSFIFKAGPNASDFYEIDHEKKSFWKETIKVRDESLTLDSLHPPASVISTRFRAPNVTISLDHDAISFTRQKAGFPWFGHEKTETINGHEAKVFSVSGVEMVTRTRTEHMAHEDMVTFEEEKKRNESQLPAMLNFLKHEETEVEVNKKEIVNETSTNPYGLTVEHYFNPKHHPNKDIGRLRKMTSKTQKFSATVALSDTFPLSLQDQVLPVINLMANSNSHFAKLRDFITLQLPAGFPVKIEIPLFHVLNARITFKNINGVDECPDGIILLEEDNLLRPNVEGDETDSPPFPKTRCIIDKSIFEVHREYRDLGTDVSLYRSDSVSYRDEEDELLQLAIQQSLAESQGSSDDAITSNTEDDMQRAIRESLIEQGITPPPVQEATPSNEASEGESLTEEEQLMLALRLSSEESQQTQTENDELQRVLALSLQDK